MEEKTCLLDVRRTPQQKGLLLLFVCSIQSLHDNDCRHDLLLQLFVLGTSAVMKPLLTDPLLHEQVTHLRLWRHKLSESQFKNFWCGCFCLFENRWFFPKMLALLLPVNVSDKRHGLGSWKEEKTSDHNLTSTQTSRIQKDLLEMVRLAKRSIFK